MLVVPTAILVVFFSEFVLSLSFQNLSQIKTIKNFQAWMGFK